MNKFEHVNASSISEAIGFLDDDWSARIIAGGTDLIHEMKQFIQRPKRLVNIKTIADLDRIDIHDGKISIGALVSIDSIQRKRRIRDNVPILTQAAGEVASPQLRNMATVVGNVLQRPRCWYYRDADTNCLRKGGKQCYAVGGDNRFQAILGGGPCHIVCASDLAPVLQALRADMVVRNDQTERRIHLSDFFLSPAQNPHRENVLAPNEIVTAIEIPLPGENARGIFLKARERRVWDFALASVSVQVSYSESGKIADADIVLGGVAPVPWVAADPIQELRGNKVTEVECARAADAAIAAACPMKDNGYKRDLTHALVKNALTALLDHQLPSACAKVRD